MTASRLLPALAGAAPRHRPRRDEGARGTMQIAILPEISAIFVLVFARVGTLVMLMPGIGERFIFSRARLSLAFFIALMIVPIAAQLHADVGAVASVHFSLAQRLGLDRLLTRIIELPRTDRWEIMARAALRDDLHAVQADLTAEAMGVATSGSTKQRINLWEKETHGVPESIKTLRSICDGKPELAKASVGLRVARGLLSRT